MTLAILFSYKCQTRDLSADCFPLFKLLYHKRLLKCLTEREKFDLIISRIIYCKRRGFLLERKINN